MSQYILINRIKVQNANAIAGFTWGFPAITHFLGFVHNLSRKVSKKDNYGDIHLFGCAVIAHSHTVHTYRVAGDYLFTQSRNPPYLHSHNKVATPPVIEEGKMNMTVSLLIAYEGDIGNRVAAFCDWLKNVCLTQRLAGGSILSIAEINSSFIEDDEDGYKELRKLKRKLLPGFILKDRSDYLSSHYERLKQENNTAELLDAWLDFSALKQKARPKSNLIAKYFHKINKEKPDEVGQLLDVWLGHLDEPYRETHIPEALVNHFNGLSVNNKNEALLTQWQEYYKPNEETTADWEYVKKPEAGYLVPIMTGYKAISQDYDNQKVSNTRDNETPVCFVESVHSIGEWLSVHKLSLNDSKGYEKLNNCLWKYSYEKNWYLCKQEQVKQDAQENEEKIVTEIPIYS